jgi:hypothetical protein
MKRLSIVHRVDGEGRKEDRLGGGIVTEETRVSYARALDPMNTPRATVHKSVDNEWARRVRTVLC